MLLVLNSQKRRNLACRNLASRIVGLTCVWTLTFCFISSASFAQDVKRGLGAGSGLIANSVNSRWAYDWNYDSPNAYNGEYVPMFWSGGNLQTKINAIKGYSNVNYVLGFNEPERADQANMTVANAINQWGTISNGFAGTGIKLVSPAVSDTASGRAWLNDFMTQVDANPNLVVDEVAFHWYGTVNINNPTGTANSFLAKVDQYHQNYGRNVWVTEFAGIDFGNNYTTEQMNQWNSVFLQTAIAGLESRDHVTRYSWWNHNNDSRLVTQDTYGLYRPTEVGDYYNKTLLSGDTQDMNGSGTGLDMIFMRGGQFVNNGSSLGPSVSRVFALANHDESVAVSDFGGSGDWGVQKFGSVTVAENATLRKIGTNTVSWRDIDIYHDGIIQLAGGSANQGTLWIQGAGTNAQGTGKIVLNSGSNLRLGNASDTAGFSLGYDIEYRGGSVTVDGVGIELNGDATIFNQLFFNANRNVVMNGSFIGNFPGLVKNGDALLTLNGENQYAGFTNVNAGILAVNGSIGGNDVRVNNGGTLAGTGRIASDIVAAAGATVTPGNSTGMLSAAGAPFRDDSLLKIEIASATDFDRLILTGAMTVESAAILELELLDGFDPVIGNEFHILQFDSFVGGFGTILTPNLTEGFWDFSRLSTDGIVSISATAVPEPSTAGILLCSLSFLGLRRRRK